MKKSLFAYLAIPLCLCMCTNPKFKDPSSHNISFITVEKEVQLELLDWGGKGEPILFLAGLGNTAHVFDDFAPQFTDHYHVLAVTRRGFGASSQPPTGYSASVLARDILTLIDSLKIKRITLIGHSIAGEELTKFASLYPNRVNRLVYIEAAYDRTCDMSIFDKAPPPPQVTKKDSASLQNLQSFYKRIYGIHLNEAEMRAGCVFAEDGHYVRDVTPEKIVGAVIKGAERPAYLSIKTKALAFFQVADSLRDIFSYYDGLDAKSQKAAREVFEVGQPFQRKQIDLFKKEMVNGQVIEIHRANHFLFLTNPKAVAYNIRKFLQSE